MGFSDRDGQGVEFIEEPGAVCGGISGKSICGELNECLVAFAILFRSGMKEMVADCYAAEVFICNGNRVAERVKQDCVCGFGAYSGECE